MRLFESGEQDSQNVVLSDKDKARLLIKTLQTIIQGDGVPLGVKQYRGLVTDQLYSVVNSKNSKKSLKEVMPYVIGFYNFVAAQYPIGLTESEAYPFCDFKPLSNYEDKAQELLDFVKGIGKSFDDALSRSGFTPKTNVTLLMKYTDDGDPSPNLFHYFKKDVVYTNSQHHLLKLLGDEGIKMLPEYFSRSPMPGLESILSDVPELSEAFESAREQSAPTIECN